VTIWTVVGGLFAARFLVTFGYAGTPATVAEALTRGLLDAWLWAALTPGLIALCRRYPLRPLTWRHGLVHLGTAPVAALVQLSVYQWLVAGLAWVPARSDDPRDLIENLLTYAVVTAVGHYLALQHETRARELRSANLETQLADARLALLRSQLRPHFLFNALHTLSELMHEDTDRAEELLTDIGDLLRASLEDGDPHLIPVREELELVGKFMSICRARHGDRIRAEMTSDAQTSDRLVPAFILQPLVENAFRHGVEPANRPGHVSVSAQTSDDAVVLQVKDDGLGVREDLEPTGAGGHGLRLVQDRLECLYGNGATMRVSPRPGGGTVAEIRVPRSATTVSR